jgi:hypothetical protein
MCYNSPLATSQYLRNSKRYEAVNLKKFENFPIFLKCRHMRAKYDQNYKNRARMRRLQNSKDNDTENSLGRYTYIQV